MNTRQRPRESKNWESFFEEGIDDAQENEDRTLDLVEVFNINRKSVSRY